MRSLKNSYVAFFLASLLVVDIIAHIAILRSVYPIYYLDSLFRARIVLQSLEDEIAQRDDHKLPDVEISKNPTHDFNIIFNEDSALIDLNRGLIKVLNEEEIKALLAHELAHPMLGHKPVIKPRIPKEPYKINNVETKEYASYKIAVAEAKKRIIRMEVEADRYASRFAEKRAIASLINKLVTDEEEKNERLEALELD